MAAAVAGGTLIIMPWEGKENVGYRDIVGVPTYCWGSTKGAVVGHRYTDAECQTALARDVREHARGIAQCLPDQGPLEVYEADLSLAFNIGVKGFCGSTVAKRQRAGEWRSSCDAFLSWNKVRNKQGVLVVSKGLDNRRKDERLHCITGATQ